MSSKVIQICVMPSLAVDKGSVGAAEVADVATVALDPDGSVATGENLNRIDAR
jgi:hypothetical protein